MNPKDAIEEALSFDPLAEAEALTGSSYKDDKDTGMLGMLFAISHNRQLNELLKASGDTCHGNNFSEDMAVIEDLGFQLLCRETFDAPGSNGENTKEEWRIYWRDGILIFLDSFKGRLNSGSAYFNLLQAEDAPWPQGLSGGFSHVEGGRVACGSIDIREGFRHRLTQMEGQGTFLSKWVERPFLWLLHHRDVKSVPYIVEDIVRERLAMLPIEVQNAIPDEETRWKKI